MSSNLRIDGARLVSRLAALSAIGATPEGGCRRLALSDEDRQGRDWLVGEMRALGLEVKIDAIGNVVAIVLITCARVSRPTTSAVRYVADFGRPITGPVSLSTSSTFRSCRCMVSSTFMMEYTPTRLAINAGVSLHRTVVFPRNKSP